MVGEIRSGTLACWRALAASDFIFAGCDARGYEFRGFRIDGAWHVVAGCRCFTAEQALRHWTSVHPNPECLALVARILAAEGAS